MVTTINLTRQELYEQVWSTPMRRLAASFNLSDVGLAKICKSHKIPRPPRGYWAKKEVGKAPPRTPLPPNSDPKIDVIRYSREESPEPDEESPEPAIKPQPNEPDYDADVMEVLEAARALPQVTTAPTLRGLHPLVQATKIAFKDARPDQHDMVYPLGRDRVETLNVSVSKASVRRSLAILDALIKSVEQVGGKVEVVRDPWGRRETKVLFCGETVATLRLRERYKKERRRTSANDPWYWPKYDTKPAGRLVLDSGDSERIYCQDTEKTRRLEDGLKDLIVRWVQDAGRRRIDRRQADEATRRREEEDRILRAREAELQRRRQNLAEQQKAEQARVETLFAEAQAWQQSQTLREYISHVEKVVGEQVKSPENAEELTQWLTWAQQQADRLDPFVASPPSILDEQL